MKQKIKVLHNQLHEALSRKVLKITSQILCSYLRSIYQEFIIKQTSHNIPLPQSVPLSFESNFQK